MENNAFNFNFTSIEGNPMPLSEYEGKAVIGKLDVDNNQETSIKFGVRSIPTLLLFKNGEVVDKQVGAVPKSTLVEKIDLNI